jgi:hypothetical protein
MRKCASLKNMSKKSSIILPCALCAVMLFSCKSSPADSDTAKSFQLNRISNIFTANAYYTYDKTEAFSYTDYGAFGKIALSLIYDTKTNMAGIQFRSNLGGYNLLMNDSTRHMLADSVKQYISDFDAKKLNKKTRQSFKVYGQSPCRMEWGLLAQTASNYAETDVQMGYMFKGKSPYFTLTVWETKNFVKQVTTSNDEDLQTTYVFMTKEQAQQLCDKLSDEAVRAAATTAAGE